MLASRIKIHHLESFFDSGLALVHWNALIDQRKLYILFSRHRHDEIKVLKYKSDLLVADHSKGFL